MSNSICVPGIQCALLVRVLDVWQGADQGDVAGPHVWLASR